MSATSDYKVILASDAHLLREALRIRTEVFHKEQGFSMDCEIDSYDPISAHFVLVPSSYSPSTAESEVKALGTLRWVPYPPPATTPASSETVSSLLPLGRPPASEGSIAATFASEKGAGAKLGRLALDKSLRGKKLGAFLVKESERWVTEAIKQRLAKANEGQATATAGDGHGLGDDQQGATAPKRLDVQFRLHSQMPVIDFYKGLGYHTEGDEFDEDGAPHMLCVKTVTVEA